MPAAARWPTKNESSRIWNEYFTRINEERNGTTSSPIYTEKDVPHPHEVDALGLLNLNPPPISSSE